MRLFFFSKLAVYHSSDAASCSQVDDVTNNASRQSLINPHISAKVRCHTVSLIVMDITELSYQRALIINFDHFLIID